MSCCWLLRFAEITIRLEEKGDERYQAIREGNAAYLFMTLSGTEHVSDMEQADYQAAAEAYLSSTGLSSDEIAQLRLCLSQG